MPLTTTITPQKYYSYKDWGQKVYDIANTALSMAQSFKGGTGGAKGLTGGGTGGANQGTFAINGFQGGLGGYNRMYNSNMWNGGLNGAGGAGQGTTGAGSWLSSNFNSGFNANMFNSPNHFDTGGRQLNAPGMAFSGLGDIANMIGGDAGGSPQTSMAGVQQTSATQQGQQPQQPQEESKGAIIGKAMGDIGNTWTSGGDTWSNIGQTIELGNTAIVKTVGNQYKEPGQRIAYGDSTYVAPSRRDLDKKTNQYVHALRDQAFYSDATTMDGLARDASQDGIYQHVSKDITSGQKWLGIGQRSLNASGKGASLGSKIGGFAGPTGSMIGTIAGGVIGGIAGIFGGAFGAKRGRERLRKIQAAQRYNNLSKDMQIQSAARNIGQRQVNNFWAHSIAKGGRIEHLINGDRLDGVSRVYDVAPSDVRPLFDIH